MIKAVIFDLDGTLSDSINSMKYCCDLTLEKFKMGPFGISEYKYFVGDGAANLIKRALKASGDDALVHFNDAYELYREIFAKNCMYQVKPYDGIVNLLKELKRNNLKLAVLSNKPHLEAIRVVEELFGESLFDVILGQREGMPIKPDPCGVYEICRQLEFGLDEIIYVGDTCTDIITGKSASAFTVGVLWGFRDRKELEDNGADAIISSPIELLKYLE